MRRVSEEISSKGFFLNFPKKKKRVEERSSKCVNERIGLNGRSGGGFDGGNN